MSDDEPLQADDGVNPDEWLQDLTYKEVHLFTEGFFRGLTNRPAPMQSHKRLQGTVLADSWYAKGGYIIGRLILVAAVLAGAGGVLPAVGGVI